MISILFLILGLALQIMVLIGVIWTVVGIPRGIYFLTRLLVNKDKTKKEKFKIDILISFAGVGVIAISLVLFFAVNFLQNSFFR